MKRKFAVILLSAALAATMLVGCGKSDREPEEKMFHGWEEEDAVYGEVSKTSEDLITIKVGTRKEMEQPKEGSAKKPEQNQAEEKPSMLDLTGEEQVIKVTEETVLKRQTMSGLPGNGAAPQKPDGEPGEDSGAMPQKPDGEPGEGSGAMPQKPDGEPGEGSGAMPQKPDREPPQEPGAGQENSSEEIAVSDISEGDIIMVTFTDDKKAAEITVLSVPEGNGADVNPPADGQDSDTGTV